VIISIPVIKSKDPPNMFIIFILAFRFLEKIINIFGGSLLLITGILMITNQLQALGYYLLEFIPFLQNLG